MPKTPVSDLRARLKVLTAKIARYGRTDQFLFWQDDGYGALLPEVKARLRSQAATGRLRVGVLVGQGYSLSSAPEIFSSLDAVIFVDVNKSTLDSIEFSIERFLEIDPNSKDPAANFYRNFCFNQDFRTFLYARLFDQESSRIRINLTSHEGAKHERKMGKFHCFASAERTDVCQEALKAAKGKIIYHALNLFDKKEVGEFADVLRNAGAEIVFFNATNVATLDHAGEYPRAFRAKLASCFSEDAVIVSSDKFPGDDLGQTYRFSDTPASYIRSIVFARMITHFNENDRKALHGLYDDSLLGVKNLEGLTALDVLIEKGNSAGMIEMLNFLRSEPDQIEQTVALDETLSRYREHEHEEKFTPSQKKCFDLVQEYRQELGPCFQYPAFPSTRGI